MPTEDFIRAILAPESGEAVIALVRVNHPDWAQPLRFAQSWQEVVHQGEAFLPSSFEIGLPDEDGADDPALVWTTGTVDREIVRRLSESTDGVMVDVIYISSARPDVAEQSFSLELAAWQADSLTLSGTLTLAPILAEPGSTDNFNAAMFPGAY